MEQPIKYSDLIQPDDSIDKLIQGLEEINQQYGKLMEKIKSDAAEIVTSLKTVSGATETGREKTKEASTETDRLSKAYKQLEQAMDKNAKEIAKLNIAKRQVTNYQKLMVQRGKEEIRTEEQIKNASYQQLSAQYSLNKAYINSLSAKERVIKKNKELIDSTRQIYEQMKRLQEETGKHQLNVGNYTSALSGFGKQMVGAAVGVGSLAAAGTMAVNAFKDGVGVTMEFEAAVSKLSAILGMSKDDMEELIEQARQLGATTTFTAQEVAELQTELAKLGYQKKDIVNMTESVLFFAQATGSSLADAASLAGASLRMFEKDTENTQEFVDKMAASTNKSALSFSYLQNAMSTVSPVANAFGFNIEDVLALLGQLANAGFDASSAATATRNILLNLADANGKLAKTLGAPVKDLDGLIAGLKKLEQGGVDLGTSLELTDKRSVAAFQTFLKGADNVLSLRNALNDADGTAKDMAKTMGDNLSGDVKSLNSAWQDFMIEINNGQGILRDAVSLLTTVVRKVSDAYKRVRQYFVDMYDDSMTFRYGVQSIKVVFEDTFDTVSGILKVFWTELKAVAHLVKGIFTLDWDEIKSGWELGTSGVFDKVKNYLKDVSDNHDKMVKNVVDGNKKIAKSNKDTAEETATDTGSAGGSGKGKGIKIVDDKAAKAAAEKAEKEAKEAAKRKLQIQRAYDDALIELIADTASKERAKLVTKYNRQIEDLRIKLETEKKLTVEERQNINNTILALEQQQADALADLFEKQAIEEMEARKKIYDANMSDGDVQQQLESLEMQRKIELAKNELAKKGKLEEQAINAKYNAERKKLLQQNGMQQLELQSELEQLQIDNMDTSENKKTELKLEAEKKRIKAIYDLNVKAGKDLNSLEMQILREQMANIDRQIEGNKKDRDIFDIFGIDVSDEKKEAISTAYSFAIDQLNEYMNALVEAANRKVELANQDVDNAQRTLDAEREARNAGYANNVEMAQKELENAKKNQEKALREQEKAQKQQQAIQALQQIGNLITSTSLIWSQLGFPWAIPAIAVMWGSFAYAKIKAAQMVGTESYGEGTVELLDGGSHQSGNDVDLGRKKDGTRRRAEGGEFFAVINKRNSRKYRKEIPDVIHALNSGTFEQKYMNAYKGSDSVIINDSQSPDLRMLSDDVAAIREQGERRTYTDADGVHVIYKNLHRVIKN